MRLWGTQIFNIGDVMQNTNCKGCDNMNLVNNIWSCEHKISTHLEPDKLIPVVNIIANKVCDKHTGLKKIKSSKNEAD